jgi:hypothetical protein
VDGDIVEDPADIAELVRSHYEAILAEPGEPAPAEEEILARNTPAYEAEQLPTSQALQVTPTASRTPLLDAVVREPVVSAEDSDSILRPITLAELEDAVKACPRGKSPGEDGLTAEFYLAAWHIIGQDFLEVANRMLQQRTVAPSHKKGIMVLLPKTSRRPETVADLRPVRCFPGLLPGG